MKRSRCRLQSARYDLIMKSSRGKESIKLSVIFALLTAANLPGQELLPEWVTTLAKIKRHNKVELQRLPNYVCLETVERFEKRAGAKSFQRRDTLKLQVAVVGGDEMMALADSPHLESMDPNRFSRAGALGTGAFSSFAANLLVHDNGRTTGWSKEELDDRPVWRFDYEIPAWRSGWHLMTLHGDVIAGERGSFWVDARSLDLLRIEISATDIPVLFDITDVATRIDYGRTLMGQAELLMPRYAESLLTDITGERRKNQMTFSGCREYHSESVIKFDSDK
jgi:hypothetical protein